MYPEQYLIHRKYSLYTSSHPFFFSLKVRGYPEPQVTWHRNGQPITSGGRFLLDCGTRGTFSLLIHAVLDEDKGKYTCEATNGSGARQVTVELTVEGESQEVKTLGRDKPSVSYGLQLLLQPSLGRGTQRKHSYIPELRTLSSYGEMWSLEQGRHQEDNVGLHITSLPGFSLPFASPHIETDWMDSPYHGLMRPSALLPGSPDPFPSAPPLWSHWPLLVPEQNLRAFACCSLCKEELFPQPCPWLGPSLTSDLCSDVPSLENPLWCFIPRALHPLTPPQLFLPGPSLSPILLLHPNTP